jgi:hypothetical protein
MATGEGSGKKQDSYRLSQMPVVLSMLDHSRDTWLSQAEFIKPNRRVVNLARIGLLFADLDTYREPWAQGRSPSNWPPLSCSAATTKACRRRRSSFSLAVACKQSGCWMAPCRVRRCHAGMPASVT